MEALVQAAEAVLRGSTAPALPLSELADAVRHALGYATLPTDRLAEALRRRPDRFRILDPGRGAWRFAVRGRADSGGMEPWVVSLGDPECPDGNAAPGLLERRLRASVRQVGISIDAGSPREVARCCAMIRAGTAAARALEGEAA